uniref:Maturase K n=1 Tax=Romanomermis culicivorax TaxID=13658 RepID=A0A915K1K9_ROMCU
MLTSYPSSSVFSTLLFFLADFFGVAPLGELVWMGFFFAEEFLVLDAEIWFEKHQLESQHKYFSLTELPPGAPVPPAFFLFLPGTAVPLPLFDDVLLLEDAAAIADSMLVADCRSKIRLILRSHLLHRRFLLHLYNRNSVLKKDKFSDIKALWGALRAPHIIYYRTKLRISNKSTLRACTAAAKPGGAPAPAVQGARDRNREAPPSHSNLSPKHCAYSKKYLVQQNNYGDLDRHQYVSTRSANAKKTGSD